MPTKKQLQNLERGKWRRGQSGNPNGRPRKLLSQIEEQIDFEFSVSLSKADKWQVLESMLELPMPKLEELAQSSDAPAFIVTIASAICADCRAGKMNTLSELFDRFFGKPIQVNKIQDRGTEQVLSEMDIEEKKALIRKFMILEEEDSEY